MASTAVLQFFSDGGLAEQGSIERGGRVRIEYAMNRLSRCFTQWRGAEFGDIIAYLRFYPRGEMIQRSVVEPVHAPGNSPGPIVAHSSAPWELSVPDDATQAEMWFQNLAQTTTRCEAWDSRFGANYWFAVGGALARIPPQPVAYRNGAQARPDVVNVLGSEASKINAFPRPASGPPQGKDIQTRLDLTVWVNHTAYGANAWIDFHVFDGNDALIHAETIAVPYAGWGPYDRYAFAGTIYQGSTATPGSVSAKPDARKLQFRLYYEIDYQIFTDGILHQAELTEDALI